MIGVALVYQLSLLVQSSTIEPALKIRGGVGGGRSEDRSQESEDKRQKVG